MTKNKSRDLIALLVHARISKGESLASTARALGIKTVDSVRVLNQRAKRLLKSN